MRVATDSTSGPQSGETASRAAACRSRKAASAVSTRERRRSASTGLPGMPCAAVGRAWADGDAADGDAAGEDAAGEDADGDGLGTGGSCGCGGTGCGSRSGRTRR
jgi:hypothetical protein